MRKRLELIPFLGVVTSVGSRIIKGFHAQDARNVRVENGEISVRRGFKRLQPRQALATAVHALFYLRGFDTAKDFVDEYLTIETVGGQKKAYLRNGTTGAPSLITAAPADLTNPDEIGWWAISNRDRGLVTNGATVWYHDVGITTSWVEAVPPTAPAAPTVASVYPPATGYTKEGWNGLTMSGGGAEVTYTGGATGTNSVSPATATGNMLINHNATGNASFEVDSWGRTAGATDWRNADCFGFTFSYPQGTGFRWDPQSLRIYMRTAGKSYEPVETIIHQVNSTTWNVYIRFQKIGERDEWGNGAGSNLMRYINFSYTVTAFSQILGNNSHLAVSPMIVGGMRYIDIPGFWSSNLSGYARIVGTFYNSVTEIESEISPESRLYRALAEGTHALGAALPKFGSRVQITIGSSAVADFENAYIYNNEDGNWYRIGQQPDGTGAWLWEPDEPITVMQLLPEFNAFPFNNVGVKSMFSYRGHTCWLYKGGENNVQYSASGSPFKQYTVNQNLEDASLGAQYSLADDYADEPEVGFDVGSSVLILGAHGAYAQSGGYARALTPLKKIPGSYGVANPHAATRWKDESGGFGVIYVDQFAESCWYASVQPSFDGEQGFVLIELSESIRGLIKSFLLSQSGITKEDIRVGTSDRTDALYIIAGKRALVFRRASVVDGKRFWELYEWNIPSNVQEISFDEVRGDRWLRAAGEFDENEWDTAAEDWIEKDAGNTIKNVYWHSKTWHSPSNSCVIRVYRTTDDLESRHAIEVVSTRKTQQKNWPQGDRVVRFNPLQQGHHHSFKVIFNKNSDSAIRYIAADLVMYGSERPNE